MTALGILLGLQVPLAPLAEVAQDWSRRGIGCSDNALLASGLAGKFDYTNTFFHRFPQVDLTAIPEALRDQLEFVSCSDILEHIPPPVDRALSGLADMLRPNGFAFVSVPVGDHEDTREFYHRLRAWRTLGTSVEWTDDDGAVHLDPSPEFHGGQGQTLAFREWGSTHLISSLKAAGFSSVWGPLPGYPEFGVPEIPRSGTFIARMPELRDPSVSSG